MALTASGAEDVPNRESVVLAEDAIQPQLAADEGGGFYVVFLHDGNVSACVSTDGGKSFSRPVVAINVQGRARGGAQRGPRIGVDAKKRIHVTAPVTFDDAEYEKKYPTAELYIVSSDDGGKTWSKPLQVNEESKKAPESLHWLAVAPSGEAHVAWLDLRLCKEGQDIFLATVADGKVSKNLKVASQVCECCAPGLAAGGDGSMILSWRDGTKGIPSREIYAIVSRNKGRSFSGPRRLNGAPSNVPG